MEHILKNIIEDVASSYGDKFFENLTLSLDKVIRSDHTFIARIDLAKNISTTIA